LATGGFERDHHVAENPWRITHGPLVHGKREHVGWSLFAAVPVVQDFDERVVHEENAELGVLEAQRGEHAQRERADSFSGEARSPLASAGDQGRHR
jgi:hypothetical protein